MKFRNIIEKKINKCNSRFNLKNVQTPKVQKKSISFLYPISKTLTKIVAKIEAKNGGSHETSIQSTDPLTHSETYSTSNIVLNSETAVNSWEGNSIPSYLSQMIFDTPYTPLESSYEKAPIAKYLTQTRPSTPLDFLPCDYQQTSLESPFPTLRSKSPPPFKTSELPGSTPSSLEVSLHPLPGQPQIPFLAYPEVLPQSPRAIVADRKVYAAYVIARRTQKRDLVNYNASEGPLEALYQLYELLLLDRLQEIQMAAKNIFYNYSWIIAEIQNPIDDPDRERYTVLACMLHLLVKTFNENIAAGVSRDTPAHLLPSEKMALCQGIAQIKFEAVPKWAQNVPPLDNMLVIPYCKYQDGQNYHVVRSWADERACTIFRTKRILLWEPNMNWRA